MSASLRIATDPFAEQLRREVEALRAHEAAAVRGDKEEARRLWAVFREILTGRPPELVERMERKQGLR